MLPAWRPQCVLLLTRPLSNFSAHTYFFVVVVVFMNPSCIAVAIGHTESVGAAELSRKFSKYALSGAATGAFVVSASKDRTLKK